MDDSDTEVALVETPSKLATDTIPVTPPRQSQEVSETFDEKSRGHRQLGFCFCVFASIHVSLNTDLRV